MLDSLRSFASTIVGKILGAVLLVGMAGWGISGVIQNLGGNTVATVGDQTISLRDFQRAYQSELNTVARQTGKVPSPQQAMAMGVPGRTLQQLAADAAMNSLANRWNIGLSQDKLAEMIGKDPTFGGQLGNFDQTTFRRALQQAGYTEDQYLKLLTNQSRRQQIALGIFDGFPPPKAVYELTNRYQNDKRTLSYFTVNSLAVPTPPAPTKKQLEDYLKAHQSEYRTQETRTTDVMVLSTAQLAKTVDVTPEEVQAAYEQNKASYVKPEKRTIRQVVLPNDAAVKAFEDGKKNGTDFNTLVAQNNLTNQVTTLGTVPKAELSDQALAKAAFALKKGSFDIIPGATGKRAIEVTDIQPGGQQSLSEVRDKVAQQLQEKKAQNKMPDVLDQIETLRAAFKPLPDIAKRFDLNVETVALTSSGDALSKVASLPKQDRQKVTTAVFNAEVGKLSPSVPINSRLQVFFDLKKVDKARDQTLDEVHDKVASAWTAEQTDKAMEKKAKDLADQINSGTAIDAVASSIGQFPQVSEPIGRNGGSKNTAVSQSVAKAAFGGGKGYVGTAKNSDGDYVVFKVTDVTPATGELNAQTRSFVADGFRNNLYAQFLAGLENDAGMQVNQKILQQALALNTGN